MYEVVISGYYGFNNAGDEAMLTAMIEALTEIEPKIGITVLSGNPEQTAKQHGVKSVHRMNYPQIVSAVERSDLLISGGGSLMQDVTSDRSLYYYLSIVLIAKKLNKPVMLYAQGFGPVRGRFAKSATRLISNTVDLITVRDDGSRLELRNIGIHRPTVYVTADPVLALHPVSTDVGKRLLAEQGIERSTAPLIGVAVREWKDWAHYKQVLAKVCDRLQKEKNAQIVFVPMQHPDDVDVAQKVARRMREKSKVLEGDYTTNELLSIMGMFDIVVGIRLHALIFAAVMEVPLVGLSYDPKIDRFLEMIGEQSVGTLQSITEQSLYSAILQELEQPRPNVERNQKIDLLRSKAAGNAEMALGLIGKAAIKGLSHDFT